jgi:hypothetical protein
LDKLRGHSANAEGLAWDSDPVDLGDDTR